jgi:hypothetical protein
MASRHYYRVFGLNIVSEFELPELIPNNPTEHPDVRILVGETPRVLSKAVVVRPCLQIAPQSLLLQVKIAADYWVQNGDTIILNPVPDAPPENVRLFLLGSAFGALLHQRGFLPIHGSALIYQQQAFILTGVTGAGKSTLAAALVNKGCRLLTDDVAAIAFESDGKPLVQPAYPQQKLWIDTADAMKLPAGRLLRVVAGKDKFCFSAVDRYHERPETVTAVFQLIKPEEGTTAKIGFTSVRGMEKISIINSNVYRPFFAKGLGLYNELLKRCFRLAEKVKIARIYRTQEVNDLEELSSTVIKVLLNSSQRSPIEPDPVMAAHSNTRDDRWI